MEPQLDKNSASSINRWTIDTSVSISLSFSFLSSFVSPFSSLLEVSVVGEITLVIGVVVGTVELVAPVRKSSDNVTLSGIAPSILTAGHLIGCDWGCCIGCGCCRCCCCCCCIGCCIGGGGGGGVGDGGITDNRCGIGTMSHNGCTIPPSPLHRRGSYGVSWFTPAGTHVF